jgi:O-methyltransferase involved in polyketide biosynthesis
LDSQERRAIKLTPEQETLLIVLYAKAQKGNPLFFDARAEAILTQVDYDFNKLKVPYKTVVLVSQRAKKLDATVHTFLAEHPNGVVLHLGCGLDSRFWRVDNGLVDWYDLDMPPVMALREYFFPVQERYHPLASSVTDLAWMDRVQAKDRPVLVVAEGLLMYLDESDVKALFLRLRSAFPGCRLVADVFSRMTARLASNHPSLKQTGARLGWGVDDAREVENWAEGIRLREEWYFSQDADLNKLSAGYRLVYKLAGAFKAARLAQRIVYYQL